jgi:hypothetical protein
MNNKFDELTKGLAQSATRRQALKKFGLGLAGMALACFGLANKAQARKCVKYGQPCAASGDCCSGLCNPNGVCGCSTGKDCPHNTICFVGYCFNSLPI